ncbi:MAG: hypothetical protein U0804_08965 [Gemmataceae bacterium]
MKIVRGTCRCGFSTNNARWGRHCWSWWFPIYDVHSGRLGEEHFQLTEEERRRLWTNSTVEEIAAHCLEVEEETTNRLRRRYVESVSAGMVLFINDHDTSSAELPCPGCHQRTLRFGQVVVWAKCRTDCGRRYLWLDSEVPGCPSCGHRPHSFEIEDENSDQGSPSCVCWCPCSSHTVCHRYENGFCPKCGSTPHGYELNGIPHCGLHHRRLIPYRVPANFLLRETVYSGESYRFPNARIWGEAFEREESVPGGYCENCEAARREWMKTLQTS